MTVKTTDSPWWFGVYVACGVGMVTCAIWADGDPMWLTIVLASLGTILWALACWVAFKRLWQD